MGATAFVMASFLNIPYVDVAVAAILPSILYYLGLFVQIDGYSARMGLVGLPRAELPRLRDVMRDGWYYIAVFLTLVWMLIYLQQEAIAPYYATALLLAINQILPQHRLNRASAIGLSPLGSIALTPWATYRPGERMAACLRGCPLPMLRVYDGGCSGGG